jgi:hypothetical protein
VSVIDGLRIAQLHRPLQVGETPEIAFVHLQALIRRTGNELLARHRNGERFGKDRQTVVEASPQLLIGQQEFIGLLVLLHRLEDVQQVGVALRKLFDFLVDVHQRATQVRLVKSLHGAVGGQRLVQLAQHTDVIENKTEFLGLGTCFVFIQAVHPGNGLQQRVLPEASRQIQHGVAWRIEASQQLVDHDQDFRLLAKLEGIDDLLVVFLLRAIAPHHPLPESHDLVG